MPEEISETIENPVQSSEEKYRKLLGGDEAMIKAGHLGIASRYIHDQILNPYGFDPNKISNFLKERFMVMDELDSLHTWDELTVKEFLTKYSMDKDYLKEYMDRKIKFYHSDSGEDIEETVRWIADDLVWGFLDRIGTDISRENPENGIYEFTGD